MHSIVCTVLELYAWDRRTDRQTNGRISALLNAPPVLCARYENYHFASFQSLGF